MNTTQAIPFPDKKYDIIYADPPWQYFVDYGRRPDNHYPTMPLSEIISLPVSTILKQNAVLYLWATIALLDSAIDVMRAWGFDYKSNMVWDKQVMGMGFWTRGQHEHLLIGAIGGGMTPESGTQHRSILSCKRGQHSVKPLHAKRMIEQYHPDTDKIELFARPSPLFKGLDDGWEYWGNEA